jgi:hypothetical protein
VPLPPAGPPAADPPILAGPEPPAAVGRTMPDDRRPDDPDDPDGAGGPRAPGGQGPADAHAPEGAGGPDELDDVPSGPAPPGRPALPARDLRGAPPERLPREVASRVDARLQRRFLDRSLRRPR